MASWLLPCVEAEDKTRVITLWFKVCVFSSREIAHTVVTESGGGGDLMARLPEP